MQLKDLEKCSTSNLMQTEKIVNITGPGEPYESQFGTLYPFVIKFESGLLGKANSKSQRYPIAIGSVVGVEINGQTPDGYSKIKVHKTPPPPIAPAVPFGSRPVLPAAPQPPFRAPVAAFSFPAAVQLPSTAANPHNGAERGNCLKIATDIYLQNHRLNNETIVYEKIPTELYDIAMFVLEASKALEVGVKPTGEIPF
jgi:hypothetical protein